MQLSRNFSLSELIQSTTATRKGIDNNPSAEHIHNLSALVENVLQPLRDKIGKPIRVTSGYRCEELNASIGGASRNGKQTSDHCFGRAVDIKLIIDGKNESQLLYLGLIEMNIPFKQLIWEFGDDETPQWCHVSFDKNNNKCQKLKAYKDNGKTKYSTI